MKNSSDFQLKINTIAFVCPAGMGTSVVGAAMLRKRLNLSRLKVNVYFSAVEEIPAETELIVTHKRFKTTLQKLYPDKRHFLLDSYTDTKGYDQLMYLLRGNYLNDH
jgi:mannitol PTS system EIICBA or EIICB component